MWNMMGCSGCRSDELNMHESNLKAENLDPAVVIQNPSTTTATTTSNNLQNPLTCLKTPTPPPTNMSPLINHYRHHQVRLSSDEQGMRKDEAAAAGAQRSRWKPTAEQLLALEEMYQRGIKTPTAQQIRQVTAQLQHYGKIQGKNVFYWFQNHRARERQKQRREMMIINNRSSHSNKQQPPSTVNETLLESKQFAGWRRTSLEVEQMKRTPFSNCTSTLSEESGNSSMQRAAAEISGMGTCGSGSSGWPDEYEERVVQSLQERTMSVLVLKSHPASFISQIAPYQHFGVVLTSNKLLGHHQFADHHGKIRDETIASSNDHQQTTLELFPLDNENLKGVNTNYLPITTTTDTTTADHFMEADQFFEFL